MSEGRIHRTPVPARRWRTVYGGPMPRLPCCALTSRAASGLFSNLASASDAKIAP